MWVNNWRVKWLVRCSIAPILVLLGLTLCIYFIIPNRRPVIVLSQNPKKPGTFLNIANHTYFYSAYWDDRINNFDNEKGNTPHIRLLGIAKHKKLLNLLCVFDNNCKKYTNIQYKSVLDTHGLEYYGYTMKCEVPKDTTYRNGFSIMVALKSETHCKNTVTLSVKKLMKEKNRLEFAICVPPVFGNIPKENLVNFIELSRILGAEIIVLYIKNITQEMKNVLEYYEGKNMVELVPWKLPDPLVPLNQKVWYNAQDVAAQDCIYSHMGRVKYIAMNDIDEMIIPYEYDNWSALINNYDQGDVSDFCFSTAFFQPGISGEGNDYKPIIQTHINRTKSYIPVRSKCIVKPEFVYDMGTHQIWGKLRKSRTVHVDKKIALLHHYRECQELPGTHVCISWIEDQSAMKYVGEITKRIKSVQQEIVLN